tara:strand:- start:416 stop:643 length:228 start_codon:yes stop_codon:yes gene_type:complete
MKKIGKTQEEKRIEEMAMCREIVQEILNFGVNNSQKERIIYLLALELENRDMMVEISKIINSEEGPKDTKNLLIT